MNSLAPWSTFISAFIGCDGADSANGRVAEVDLNLALAAAKRNAAANGVVLLRNRDQTPTFAVP